MIKLIHLIKKNHGYVHHNISSSSLSLLSFKKFNVYNIYASYFI